MRAICQECPDERSTPAGFIAAGDGGRAVRPAEPQKDPSAEHIHAMRGFNRRRVIVMVDMPRQIEVAGHDPGNGPNTKPCKIANTYRADLALSKIKSPFVAGFLLFGDCLAGQYREMSGPERPIRRRQPGLS